MSIRAPRTHDHRTRRVLVFQQVPVFARVQMRQHSRAVESENDIPTPGFKAFMMVLLTGFVSGFIFGALITVYTGFSWAVSGVIGLVGALSLGVGYAFAGLLAKTFEVFAPNTTRVVPLVPLQLVLSVTGAFLISLLVLSGLPYVYVFSGALYFALCSLGITILCHRRYFETQKSPLL